ncbi:MAG: flavodoxin family protein [Ruminiclostridium sp.]
MKKILIVAGCLVGIVVLLIIGMMAVMFFLNSSNNAYKGEYTNVLKSATPSTKKALVVYQPSRSKEFGKITDQLAKGLNESGYEVTVSYPGKHLSADVKDYSVLAFGSPIYMGKPSTALTDYMKQIKALSNKRIIVFSIGSIEATPEFEIFKTNLSGGEIYKQIKFIAKDESDEKTAYKLGLEAGKNND